MHLTVKLGLIRHALQLKQKQRGTNEYCVHLR